MRLIRDFECNRWHWALRFSVDYLTDGYDRYAREVSVTVALGPWVGSLGLKWYARAAR